MRGFVTLAMMCLALGGAVPETYAQGAPEESALRATPPALRFARVAAGEEGTPRRVALRNVGDETLIVYALGLPADFRLVAFDCFDHGLAPGQRCRVSVAYSPTDRGADEGVLRVQYCFPSDPVCPGAVFGQERYIDIPLSAASR